MEQMNKPRPIKDQITLVAPNGATLEIKYHPHDHVGKTLEQGVREFAKSGDLDPNQDYLLVLQDTPLDTSLTLEEAGVREGATLKIRSKRRPVDGHAS